MPLLMIDSEQGDLVEIAVQMMHAALGARAKRRDPDRLITDSMVLQQHKLTSVLNRLKQSDPIEWDEMTPDEQAGAILIIQAIQATDDHKARRALWAKLRGLTLAVRGP